MGLGGRGGDEWSEERQQWVPHRPPVRRPPPLRGDPRVRYPSGSSPRPRAGDPARHPAGPRRVPSGARTARPAPAPWQLPAQLPTAPTLLAGGAAVVLAFLLGHVTAGGGDVSVAGSNRAAVVATTTTTTTPSSTHTVAPGETLSSIAGIYGLQPQALAINNGISDQNHLVVGEVLKIPPTSAPTTAPVPTTRARR